jgi:hypothetical protein
LGKAATGLKIDIATSRPITAAVSSTCLAISSRVVDARGDDGLDGRRQRYGVDAVLQPVCAPFAVEIAALRDCGGEFLDERTGCLRALDDIAGKRGERRILRRNAPATTDPHPPIRAAASRFDESACAS